MYSIVLDRRLLISVNILHQALLLVYVIFEGLLVTKNKSINNQINKEYKQINLRMKN